MFALSFLMRIYEFIKKQKQSTNTHEKHYNRKQPRISKDNFVKKIRRKKDTPKKESCCNKEILIYIIILLNF